MAGKVLSIEVGYSITRVIEMDFGAKNPKVYNAFSFETPPDVLSDEGVQMNESMIALMKQNLKQNNVRTSKAIFTISSTRIASREVAIPAVKDNKIKSLLVANSRDYFPVDLAQYELVYRVVERMKDEKQIKLVVFAVPRSLVESYQNLARAWGLTIVGLDYSGNSVCQAINRLMDPAFSVVIRVDDRISTITIINSGKVELQRTIGYGIDEAVELVRGCALLGMNATYTDALKLMRRKFCLNQQMRPEADDDNFEDIADPDIMDIRDDVTSSLTMLISNISRVMDYYISRNQDVNIEKIHLIGLGADCRGLSKLLTNELGIPVNTLQELKEQNLNRSINDESFKVAEYITCIGATFAPLNFMIEAEKEGSKKKSNESMAMPILLFAVCVVASVAMVALGAIGNMVVEGENVMLRAEIDSKRDVVELYNEYLTEKMTYEGTVYMDNMTEEPNTEFLNFLAQMEEKMPQDLLITSLVAGSEGITLSLTTSSVESAAEAIIQFRTFTGVGRVQCSGVTEQIDDNGALTEYFDVTMTYTQPQEEVESGYNPESQQGNGEGAAEDQTSADEYSVQE